MFTNNINARKMIAEAFSYSAPAPAPAPKAPRGKALAKPAEEQFESDSESSYQGSVGSATSLVSTDEVPVPPLGSAAPRIGPTKSAKNKKVITKKMPKPKSEKPLPPPVAPVLKESPAPETKKKASIKKLTAPPAPVADLPAVKVDLPEKIVLAQKLENPEKKKRAPSAYNKFVSGHMKAGKSMVEIAGLWKQQKLDAK